MSTTVKVYRSGTPHALRLACFAVSILLFCVVAGGSFGLVWLRQGIAQSAQTIKGYERDLAEASRLQAHLQAKIAQEEQPEKLKRRTSATLMVPDNRQYVYVAPSQLLRTRAEVQLRALDFGFEIAYNPQAAAEAARNVERP